MKVLITLFLLLTSIYTTADSCITLDEAKERLINLNIGNASSPSSRFTEEELVEIMEDLAFDEESGVYETIHRYGKCVAIMKMTCEGEPKSLFFCDVMTISF